jgi:hypothetical protein
MVLQDKANHTAVEEAMKAMWAILPEYMVPHIKVVLEILLNTRAKISCRRLEEMYYQCLEKHICALHRDVENKSSISTREHLT